MSEPASEGARCAAHPDSAATWLCGRCGSFMCTGCERRVRPEALPMCPACWELRSRTVEALVKSPARLPLVGLVLGLLALWPGCWAMQVGAGVVNGVALYRSRGEPWRARWREGLGLAFAGLGLVVSILWVASDL